MIQFLILTKNVTRSAQKVYYALTRVEKQGKGQSL